MSQRSSCLNKVECCVHIAQTWVRETLATCISRAFLCDCGSHATQVSKSRSPAACFPQSFCVNAMQHLALSWREDLLLTGTVDLHVPVCMNSMLAHTYGMQVAWGMQLGAYDSTAAERSWCQLLGRQFRCCMAFTARSTRFSVISLSYEVAGWKGR